eukprot:GABV01002485.1.p2 GENE.GABV01002485.1~~GABV01002485.1.p2  ORF type:complete len:173 (-),score=40.09 GABV01002485.1:171-644(-)
MEDSGIPALQAAQLAACAVPNSEESPSCKWSILTSQFQEETLLDFLNFAVESGDVQLAATVLSVCQDFVRFPQRQSIRLFRGYIDLLRRQRLFSEATDVLLACPHPQISQQNQNRTSISLSCARCRKPLGVEDEAFCNKCRRIPTICVVWFIRLFEE